MQHLLLNQVRSQFRFQGQVFTGLEKEQISTGTVHKVISGATFRLKTIGPAHNFFSSVMKIPFKEIHKKFKLSSGNSANSPQKKVMVSRNYTQELSKDNKPKTDLNMKTRFTGDSIPDIKPSREVLYQRHRLSHQQIDDFLGEDHHDLVFEEKINQLRQVAWFLEITDALRKADIWFVAYKGPLLSYRIYNDSTCRRFKDFDFLVKPDKVPETIAIMCKMGFIPRTFQWPASRNKEQRLLFFLNQYVLEHSSKQISVEVHWSLVKYPAVSQKKMAAIVNENLQQTVFAGKKFNQFTPELELLHLVIHGGLHTWSRLKWLVDIHEIINRFQIDKTKFETLAELLHAKRLVGLCNEMLGHYFPGTALLPVDYRVPKWFLKYPLHQIGRSSDTPVFLPEDLFKYRWFHIEAFPNWRHRLRKVFVLFVFFLQNQKRKLFQLKRGRIT